MDDYTVIPELRLLNGARVLQAFVSDNGADSPTRYGLQRYTASVLAEQPQEPRVQFVVWDAWYDGDAECWATTNGHYYDEREQAEFQLGRRILLNCRGAIVRGTRSVA